MDREIKFRGWDTGINKMWSEIEIGRDWLSIHPDGRGFVNVNNITRLSQYYTHIIPLQYTGLKDKNGKEIYEGDIVKLWFDEGEEIFWNSFLVKFFEGCFICEFLQGDTEEYPIYEYWNDSQDLEIIGNIYENPELLTNN